MQKKSLFFIIAVLTVLSLNAGDITDTYNFQPGDPISAGTFNTLFGNIKTQANDTNSRLNSTNLTSGYLYVSI